jgi:hypothetical protein
MQKWLTLIEAAEFLGIHPIWLKLLKSEGKIPSQNILEWKYEKEPKTPGRSKIYFLIDTSKTFIKYNSQKTRYANK